MMHGYGYMSSGDWLGIAALLMLWTVLVVGMTVWAVGSRARRPVDIPAEHDGT